MDKIRQFLLHEWMSLVVPLCVLTVTMLAGYALKRFVFSALRAWAAKTKSQAALIATQALEGPFLIWVAILAIHLALKSSELPPKVTGWSANILLVLWVLSFTIVATRLAGDLIRYYGNVVPGVLPVTTLTQNVVQLGVVIFGLLILLAELGVNIVPILGALGVGGLAIALALQDTLSNLFAGFYVAVAGQIRLGDYVRLSSGEEGYVTDITWRSTTIRALANNLIVVPNAKLGQAIVTNFYLPEKRIPVSVQVGVDYGSDPDRIEALLVDEARQAIGEVPGLLAEPGPVARFDPGFGPSSLDFTVTCHVAEFADQYFLRHYLRKRIFKRFRAEGIEFPLPTQTVYVRGEEKTENPPKT